MPENKKNKKGLIILVLLLAVIITGTFAVTYSRYVSSVDGTASVKVAKWAIEVEGQDIVEITQDLSLETCEMITGDVFAPGASCRIPVNIVNKSQVPAEVSVELDSLKNGSVDVSTTHDGVITVALDVASPLELGAEGSMDDSADVYVIVTWAAGDEAGSEADTTLGSEAPNLTLGVKITAKQKLD